MHDLARFYEALRRGGTLDGVRLLDADTAADMTRRHRTGLTDRTFGVVIDWGLGVILHTPQPAGLMPYGYGKHASPQTFGHGGVRSVAAFADPDQQLAVALAFTGMPRERDHQRRAHDTLTALYHDLGLTK